MASITYSGRLPVHAAQHAARELIRRVTDPDRQWTTATAQACPPPGWEMSAVDQSVFFPLTIRNAATAFREFSRRAFEGK